MKDITQLHNLYTQALYNLTKWKYCVNWAVDCLVENNEIDDEEIILLASSNLDGETKALTEAIINNYLPKKERNKEYWAGKYIVELYKNYHNKSIDINNLEYIISTLYNSLGYPNWLAMLARNCEYATDVQEFEKPFNDEFNYINKLWLESESIDDFNNIYSREISNTHDFKNC